MRSTVALSKSIAACSSGDNPAIVPTELASSTSFDEIIVGGLLTYDGTLGINLFGGFYPQIGDTFALFDSASVAGTFDAITFNVAGYAGTLNHSTSTLTISHWPDCQGNATGLDHPGANSCILSHDNGPLPRSVPSGAIPPLSAHSSDSMRSVPAESWLGRYRRLGKDYER